jgi:hypothetical protein
LNPLPVTEGSTSTRRGLKPGTRIEVRNRFDGGWSAGFEVADLDGDGDGYLVRRISDGSLLPVPLPRGDVRRERRRQTWWV